MCLCTCAVFRTLLLLSNHTWTSPQPPPLQPRRVRPLPPAPQLLAAASVRVLSWARQRVRDDVGLEKLLHEAAVVSVVQQYKCAACRSVALA